MTTGLRETLKAAMPRPIRMAVRRALQRPPIETAVLRDYRFAADPEPKPRLSMVLPSLSRQEAFGGVLTGVDFFRSLGRSVLELGVDLDLRLVCEAAHDPADSVADAPGALPVYALRSQDWRLPTRARELFLAFNWWTRINLEPVLAAQTAHFGGEIRPLLYIMQDYEPGFYPMSAAQMLAREACSDGPMPLWLILNTHELAAYWRQMGHSARQLFVFEPRMSPALRTRLDGLRAEDKERILLVYGRPGYERNCFSLLVDGLRRWAATTRAAADWRVVSAGVAHRAIRLSPTRRLESLGKLSLADYAEILRRAAVGVSLMASPHPSYPPLEMAHFGVRTITNRFPPKDPLSRHENLIPLDRMRADALAGRIEEAVLGFEADPARGLRARSFMPDYLSDRPPECLRPLAHEIVRRIGPEQERPAWAGHQ